TKRSAQRIVAPRLSRQYPRHSRKPTIEIHIGLRQLAVDGERVIAALCKEVLVVAGAVDAPLRERVGVQITGGNEVGRRAVGAGVVDAQFGRVREAERNAWWRIDTGGTEDRRAIQSENDLGIRR